MKNTIEPTLFDNFKCFVYHKNTAEAVKAYCHLSEEFKADYLPINYVIKLLEGKLDAGYVDVIEALLSVDCAVEIALIEKVTPTIFALLEPIYKSIGLIKTDLNGNTYLHNLLAFGAYQLVISILNEYPQEKVIYVCSRLNNLGLSPLMMVIKGDFQLPMSEEQFRYFDYISQQIHISNSIHKEDFMAFKNYIINCIQVDKEVRGLSYSKFKINFVCSLLKNITSFELMNIINKS